MPGVIEVTDNGGKKYYSDNPTENDLSAHRHGDPF